MKLPSLPWCATIGLCPTDFSGWEPQRGANQKDLAEKLLGRRFFCEKIFYANLGSCMSKEAMMFKTFSLHFPTPKTVVAPFLLMLLLALGGGQASGQGTPKAEALLGKTDAVVGESIPLQVIIESAEIHMPDPEIYVDGLDIHFIGRQTRIESINSSTRISTKLSWIVVPRREGEFEIPALSFVADGKRITTNPLRLRVSASAGTSSQGQPSRPGAPSGPPGSQSQASPPDSRDETFLAELRLPSGRREFYVGEMIPVEIIFGVDEQTDARVQNPQKPPDLSQKDFSTHKLSNPQSGRLDRGERSYSTLSYRTAIAPVKSGELELPRAELPILILTQETDRGRPSQRRNFDPFDPFSIDSIFEDFFNTDPFLRGRPLFREVTLATPEGSVVVKPLPKEGRPDSFDGAVGKFTLTAFAKPQTPGPGDPVQLRVEIRGEGNFDSVTAPKLDGLRGWRVYPPTSQFNPSNETQTKGAKTFEIVLVPSANAEPLEQIEFSFFDPETAQYHTVHSEQLGIHPKSAAIGPPASAQTTPSSGNASTQKIPAKTAPNETFGTPAETAPTQRNDPDLVADDDLLHIQTAHPDPPRQLQPPWSSGFFVWINAIIALAAIASIIGRLLISHFSSPEIRLQRIRSAEKARLMLLLRSQRATARELLDAAVKLIEQHSVAVDPNEKTWILAQRDRLCYGGGGLDELEHGTLQRRLREALQIK